MWISIHRTKVYAPALATALVQSKRFELPPLSHKTRLRALVSGGLNALEHKPKVITHCAYEGRRPSHAQGSEKFIDHQQTILDRFWLVRFPLYT